MNIFFKIVATLVLLSSLGACATSNNGYYGYEPTSKRGDIESQRAEENARRECRGMPPAANSGGDYFCNYATGQWVSYQNRNKSLDDQREISRIEDCIARVNRNRYSGQSSTITCGPEYQRRNSRSGKSQRNLDFVINKRKVRLIGYENCAAEVVLIEGTSLDNFNNDEGYWGEKNRDIKIFTSNRSRRGDLYSRFHYVDAHEVTFFHVVMHLPGGGTVGPALSDPMFTPEGTDREKLFDIHSGLAFYEKDAEIIKSRCLLN